MLDWSKCPVLESIPGKVSGAWVFRGTRVPVSAILKNLKHMTPDQLVEDYPSVPREQIEAVLDFLARSADPVFFGGASSRHRDPCASSSMKISPTGSGCCLPAMKSELPLTRDGPGLRMGHLIVLSDNDESVIAANVKAIPAAIELFSRGHCFGLTSASATRTESFPLR